jgi:5'-phosphate synthase pdxT subunit
MTIGVLALQGDFAEHLAMLTRIGVDAREVRKPSDLEGVDALIIPGGESTTIGN